MGSVSLDKFAARVSKLMPDIMRQFLKEQTKEVAQGKISLPQLLILDILKDKETMRMGELAKYLSVSMSAVTGIVDKLVKHGLVIRLSIPGDRRIVNIKITPRGRQLAKRHEQAKQKSIMEIFGNLGSTDRDKYLEILNKIHKNLKGTA